MEASALYDRFSVVAFAPGWIIEDLRKVRARCPKSGVPVMDAHVTVKGGFSNPRDLSVVQATLAECMAGHPPFTVRTTEPQVIEHGGNATVLMPLEESRQLAQLHDRMLQVLRPLGDSHTYPGDQPGQFQPHVTVAQAIPIDGVEQTLKAVIGWRVNYFWTIRDVDLVGRQAGTIWRSLRRFEFGRPG